jgi:hypothetical protein
LLLDSYGDHTRALFLDLKGETNFDAEESLAPRRERGVPRVVAVGGGIAGAITPRTEATRETTLSRQGTKLRSAKKWVSFDRRAEP